MSMKISTITCHNVYNHGALLQAWALATYLSDIGHDCSIIDYQPDYLTGHYDFKINNKKYDRPLLRWIYLLFKYPSWRKSLQRKNNFDSFFNRNIRPLLTARKYSSIEELRQNPPNADVYIAGSDQIWNTFVQNGNDASFYLDFGNNTIKKISYAASFSTEIILNSSFNFVKEQLKKFNRISVRETSGINILNDLGLTGSVVSDPVFLIDREKWEAVMTPINISKKYILIYDTKKSKDLAILAKRMSKIMGMPIYSISGFNLPYAKNKYRMGGPDIFLSLVKNAECVISNSFHATAFSIIFNRDFIVVKRPDGLNKRMEDLLSAYDLSSRLMSATEDYDRLCSHIDYSLIQRRIRGFRVESEKWLQESLNGNEVN